MAVPVAVAMITVAWVAIARATGAMVAAVPGAVAVGITSPVVGNAVADVAAAVVIMGTAVAVAAAAAAATTAAVTKTTQPGNLLTRAIAAAPLCHAVTAGAKIIAALGLWYTCLGHRGDRQMHRKDLALLLMRLVVASGHWP